MGKKLEAVCGRWEKVKNTSTFHDVMLFLVFVCIATLFWYILALNDSAQASFNVRISIVNCPDSVTFISDIPDKMHVSVRDKGTTLWRNRYRKPTVIINFKEYAQNGVLKFSHNDMLTSLKTVFGSGSQILSLSTDSISLDYTTNKGRRVPVVIRSNVMAASGNIIDSELKAKPSNVLVYGEKEIVDTVHKVMTELIKKNNLTETTTVDVDLSRIKGVRVIPSYVSVTIPVEPLVRKQSLVTVTPINVPHGENLLIFPSRVSVDYYVAMSKLGNDEDPNIELTVDYNSIRETKNGKLHVMVHRYPERLQNLSVINDSVEYTIVKN